jgi:hypothetical protein
MRATLALAVLAAGLGASASAQEPQGPPKVLVVTREAIKPGKMAPHTKVAASYVALATRANAPNYRLGLIPFSGDQNAVIYLEAHPSFAALEAAGQAFDGALASNAALKAEMDAVDRQGDMHEAVRTTIYRYRPDLSFRPGGMEDVARARYMTIATTRVKAGRQPDYVEYVKGQNAAREKANSRARTAVYQNMSGAPFTFAIFTTARSLSEWDDNLARGEENTKAMEAALGGAEAARQQRMIFADVVAESASATYAMSPEISRPLPQLVAYDPGFWGGPRAVDTKALASKKEPRKAQPKQ